VRQVSFEMHCRIVRFTLSTKEVLIFIEHYETTGLGFSLREGVKDGINLLFEQFSFGVGFGKVGPKT
jgi:hypothetical protein